MSRPQPSAPTLSIATVRALWSSFVRGRRGAGEGPRLLKDAAWIAGSQSIAAVATLVGVRLVTELAQPSLFGSFVLVNGVLALLQGVLFQPFAQAGLRFYSEFEALGQVAALRDHMSVVFRRRWLVGSMLIAGAALLDVTTTRYLSVGTWFLLVAGLALEGWKAFAIVMRSAARRQPSYAALYTADSLARPAGSVLAAWILAPSVETLLLGQTLGCLLVLAGFAYDAGRENIARETVSGEVKGDMARFAAPLVWTPIFSWISGLADRYIVGGMLGLSQAGIYSAAYGIASRPLVMLGTVSEATMRQVLYASVAKSDRARTSRTLVVWVIVNLAWGVLLAALIAAFRDPLAQFLLAESYRPAAATLLPWVAFGHIPLLAAQAVERLAYARHRTRAVMLVQAACACLSVLAATLGAAWAGLTGVAKAVPVYFSLQLLLTVWIALRPRR